MCIWGLYCERHGRAFFFRGDDPELVEKWLTAEPGCPVQGGHWGHGETTATEVRMARAI